MSGEFGKLEARSQVALDFSACVLTLVVGTIPTRGVGIFAVWRTQLVTFTLLHVTLEFLVCSRDPDTFGWVCSRALAGSLRVYDMK